MQTSATSVVSAAVIGGDLILGLSDGALINCGRVQGPQGLKGDPGPMGATGRDGQDGNTIHTVEGIPQASLGRDGDFAIDVTKWEIYGPRANMQWGTPTPLRGKGGKGSNERYNAFGQGSPGSGGDGSGGGGQTYTTANLPLAGTGRLVQKNGRISVPGGNIIPEANGLKYQSNLNSWSYDSLAALDEALPINKVDDLPDEGKYEGDMVLHGGALWIWSNDNWIEIGGAVDVSDFALKSSVQRVEDNLDLVQETVGAGEYTRKAKPQTPVGPGEGEACFLQDGGAEATTFAEVENIQLNKVGIGPYADFTSAKKGDYLLLQSAVDGDFGLYVIRNATEFGTFWDFGLEIASGKAVGTVPEIDESIIVRTSRPTFTVAQDTPPDFSATGQLWFDTAEHQLKVWDDEAQEFVGTGGGEGANVHVGELPPDEKAEGDLWYDSTRLELFVFYVDGDDNGGWVPCSPLGARVEAGEIIQQQLLERVSDGEAIQATLQNTVDGHGNALNDLYATQSDLLTSKGSNDVTTAFRIKSGGKTLISASSNHLSLYNVVDPSHPSHAATAGYVDNHNGRTWKWIVDGSTVAQQRQAIRWYTQDNHTLNLYVHGIPLTGHQMGMINGLKSRDGMTRVEMSIYGFNGTNTEFILIGPLRSWEMAGDMIALRLTMPDMEHWNPTALENETPVNIVFGGPF